MSSILDQYAPRPVFEDSINEKTRCLEQRVARYAIAREHGISARYAMNEKEQSIDYIIERPDGEKTIQIYDKKGLIRILDSHRAKLVRVGKSEYSYANFFQGRLGEIIMHIMLREFFDRLRAKRTGHAGFSYRAVRGRYGEVIARNETYALTPGKNNNFFTHRNSQGTHLDVLGEFDGLYEITEWGKKSMVICEAKTSMVSICTRKNQRQRSLTHIEKVMEPVRSLFPDHKIFYLVMATRGQIVSNKYNYLVPSMAKKAEDIMAADIIPVFMPYCERSSDFERMGDFVQESLSHLVGIDIPLLREVMVNLESGKVQIGSSSKGVPLRFEYDHNGRWKLYGQDDDDQWYEMHKTSSGFKLTRY